VQRALEDRRRRAQEAAQRETVSGVPAARSRRSPCPNLLLDTVNGISNGSNLVRIIVGNIDVERFFEGQGQIPESQRIGTEVFAEERIPGDALFGNVEPLLYDVADLFGNFRDHKTIVRLARSPSQLAPPSVSIVVTRAHQ
jgi:hypothetical protein